MKYFNFVLSLGLFLALSCTAYSKSSGNFNLRSLVKEKISHIRASDQSCSVNDKKYRCDSQAYHDDFLLNVGTIKPADGRSLSQDEQTFNDLVRHANGKIIDEFRGKDQSSLMKALYDQSRKNLGSVPK